jgi:hypothetical protein
MTRYVDAHDLELFAINSGELYERHKQLAQNNKAVDWLRHVLNRVHPLYCRQVEPVKLSTTAAAVVACQLAAYYVRHIEECLGCASDEMCPRSGHCEHYDSPVRRAK